jgi:alkylhydroperoxidase family enzyme
MDIRHAVGVKMGVPVDKLADLPMYRESRRFSERERSALDFCERITRDDLEVSDECFVRLQEHFVPAEIVELTFIIGYQTFASKFAKAFGLAPQGFSDSEFARKLAAGTAKVRDEMVSSIKDRRIVNDWFE